MSVILSQVEQRRLVRGAPLWAAISPRGPHGFIISDSYEMFMLE